VNTKIVTAKLDDIADKVEGDYPKLAMAIDAVSNPIEKTAVSQQDPGMKELIDAYRDVESFQIDLRKDIKTYLDLVDLGEYNVELAKKQAQDIKKTVKDLRAKLW